VRFESATAEHIAAGDGFLDLGQAFGRTAVEDFTAALSCARTDIDEPVRMTHEVNGVFDDEETVAALLETVEDLHQSADVLGVQTGRRLVEDVDDPEELRGQLA
jgi:hypothetical protein